MRLMLELIQRFKCDFCGNVHCESSQEVWPFKPICYLNAPRGWQWVGREGEAKLCCNQHNVLVKDKGGSLTEV